MTMGGYQTVSFTVLIQFNGSTYVIWSNAEHTYNMDSDLLTYLLWYHYWGLPACLLKEYYLLSKYMTVTNKRDKHADAWILWPIYQRVIIS
jgi:hypothetical protein